ncbi:MAG: dihydroorotase [Bacteroidia bacterium]
MAKILLQDVHLIDPNSKFHDQIVSILVENGAIKQISQSKLTADQDTQLIAEEGLYVSPGWVDTHVQLSDPGYEYKESLESLSKAAVKGGFTTLLAYPNTSPVIDNAHMVDSLKQRTQGLPVNIRLAGSITQGAEGKELAEMYDMHQHGALAFTDGSHPLQHAGLVQRALLYTQSFDGLLIQYPTDQNLTKGGQMHEGEVSTKLGMKGIPAIAESMGAVRDLHLQKYVGGRIHFHPVTTAEAIASIEHSKLEKGEVSMGTNITYLAHQDEDLVEYDTHYKLSPPLRDQREVDAIIEAIKIGQITVLATGHQAQGIEEKKLQFENAEAGILGLQTAFSIAYDKLVAAGHISLSRLIELISHEGRRLLGLPAATIEEDGLAELTVFAPNTDWTLNPSQIPSRAKNSPYLGQKLSGKVFGIIQNGKFHSAN